MSTAFLLVALLVPVQPQVAVSGGIEVQAHVPAIRFEAEPALVLVTPGVMVVPNHDREVFFAGGHYWYNVNGAWFRTRSHRGGWVRVATGRVPVAIVRLPRGQYRHFRGGRLVRRAGRPPPRRPAVKVIARKKVKARPTAMKTRAKAKTKAKAKAKRTARRSVKKTRVRTARRSVKKSKVRSARRASARRRRH